MRKIVVAVLGILLLTATIVIADALTITDLSGNDNHGTANDVYLTHDGAVFNGSTDSKITVADSDSLDLGTTNATSGTLTYRIAIISDVHIGQTNSTGEENLNQFVSISNSDLQPNIVLTAGDLFEHSGTYAQTFLTIMDGLDAPWYYVWGDHDWGGAYPYDGREDDTTLSIQSYLETMGVNADFRRYTYLDVDDDGANDFMLVVLPPTITDDDLAWFDSLPTDAPMIVVHHVPAAMNGWLTYDPDTAHANMLLQNAETVRQHFEDKGTVFMVISGHDHGYVGATQVNGIWYVNTRRTGSTWGSDEGYNVLDFYTNGTVEFYTKWFDGDGSKDNVAELRTPEYGFSIEVVFKPTVLNAYNYLFDKGVAGNRNYGMAITDAGGVFVKTHDTEGEKSLWGASGRVSVDTEHRAIMVANNTALKLWVDGNYEGSTNTVPPYTANGNALLIGTTYSNPYTGYVREFKMYTVPLDEATVMSHFGGGEEDGGYGKNTMALWYDLDIPYNMTVHAKDYSNNTIYEFYAQVNGTTKNTTNGTIYFTDLEEGTYTVNVWGEPYELSSYSVSISGSDAVLNATLMSAISALSSVYQPTTFIVMRDWTPLAGANVSVWYNGILQNMALTGNDGAAVFYLFPNRKYTITVNGTEKEVEVMPSMDTYYIMMPTSPYTLTSYYQPYNYSLSSNQSVLSGIVNPATMEAMGFGELGKGIITSSVMWTVMAGSSVLHLGMGVSAIGLLALIVMALLGMVSWFVVLLCGLTVVGVYILRGGLS